MRRCLTTLSVALALTATAVLLAIRGIALSDTNTGEQTVNSLFVTRQDSLIYRLEEGKRVPVFEIQNRFQLSSLSVSPNDSFFAFIEVKSGEFHTPEAGRRGRYDVLPEIHLRIIRHDGVLMHSLKDAQRYVWSPDGNSVAYITFDLTYADYQYRRPTGLYVFDIISGQRKRINTNASEVYWASHDGRLYMTTRYAIEKWVLRWDPRTDRVEKTSYKDIYFSPDGKYYLSLWKLEYKPIQLYDAATNEELISIKVYERSLPPGVTAEAFPTGIGELAGGPYLRSLKPWVPESNHLLLFVKEDVEKELAGTGPVKRVVSRVVKGAEYYLFDVEEREVVRRFSGKPTEWIGNGKVLVLERDGKLVFERLVPED